MHHLRRLVTALILVGSSVVVAGAQPVLRLEPSSGDAQRDFGSRVALSNDFVAVSALGIVNVFDRTTGAFVRQLPNPEGVPGVTFGTTLAAFGSDFLVGDFAATDLMTFAGAVYRFDPATGTLLRTYRSSQLTCGNCQGNFSASMAGVGGNVLIGAPNHDTLAAADAGAVYLLDASTGTLLRTFTSPHPTTHEPGRGNFGYSVADVGGDVLVSAPFDVPAPGAVGAVYLFDATTGAVVQEFVNSVPNPDYAPNFGAAVAAFGSTIVVGAPLDSPFGAVHLFDAATGALLRTLVSPNASAPCDGCGSFGAAVATLGTDVLVGAPYDSVDGLATGAAYLFDSASGALKRTFRSPAPGSDDAHGASVAAADETIVIGAPRDEGAGRNALGAGTGAAHVFYGGANGCGPVPNVGTARHLRERAQHDLPSGSRPGEGRAQARQRHDGRARPRHVAVEGPGEDH